MKTPCRPESSGLLRAIDAYKPEAAASFESYAILRIRGSILDAVRSLDTVGRAGREAARAIQGAIRDLQHELGRSPSEGEIAGTARTSGGRATAIVSRPRQW